MARSRARDSTVLLNMCAFFLLMGLCNCALESTLCSTFNQPIELYVFRRVPPNPNATVAFVYPPGANGTQLPPVGVPAISVSDNPVRKTQSEGSPLLGYQNSLRIMGLQSRRRIKDSSN